MAIRPVRGEPGVFVDSGGNKFKVIEFREDDIYDTVDFASGAISAGTEKQFFRDLDNKDLLDTNLKTSRRVSGGTEAVIERVGVQIPNSFGNTNVSPSDIKKLSENGFLQFKINETKVAEGPLIKFPSGYGLSGQTQENATGVVQIGVPSTAAQAKLARDQYVNNEHDLDASLKYFDRLWRSAGTTNMPTIDTIAVVRLFLRAMVKAAATKG